MTRFARFGQRNKVPQDGTSWSELKAAGTAQTKPDHNNTTAHDPLKGTRKIPGKFKVKKNIHGNKKKSNNGIGEKNGMVKEELSDKEKGKRDFITDQVKIRKLKREKREAEGTNEKNGPEKNAVLKKTTKKHLKGNKSSRECYECGKEGHVSMQCPDTTCNNCNEKGHRCCICPDVVCIKCQRKGHKAFLCNKPWMWMSQDKNGELVDTDNSTMEKNNINGPEKKAVLKKTTKKLLKDDKATQDCFLCGKTGHVSLECPDTLCYTCNKKGHQSGICPDIVCKRCHVKGHKAFLCHRPWVIERMEEDIGKLEARQSGNVDKSDDTADDAVENNENNETSDEDEDSNDEETSAPEKFNNETSDEDEDSNDEETSAPENNETSDEDEDIDDEETSAPEKFNNETSDEDEDSNDEETSAPENNETSDEDEDRDEDEDSNDEETSAPEKTSKVNLVQRGNKLDAKKRNINETKGPKLTKHGREIKKKQSEARRLKRQADTLNNTVCYNCRESGHRMADCPAVKKDSQHGTDICYKCGSTEHAMTKCRLKLPPGEFPYAKCFICGETGHFSRMCPDNPRGLYPNGGCCNECGSVEHLRRDCPDVQKQQGINSMKLGRMTANSVDADDAVVVAENKNDETNSAPPMKKRKKVVQF